MNCETTNKKNIALRTFDVNNMNIVIDDLESNRGKDKWSISVNRVSNGVANGHGMELSKNRTEVYEDGALVEVMDMSIDTQIECMEISKSCAKTELVGLERGQRLRKYKCIARRFHRFTDLLKEESLRKTYTYLDDPWRAANGARFFKPPPVAEYGSWIEVLREEGHKFGNLADELEAEGGILYEDVAPCKNGPYKGDRVEGEGKGDVTPEQNSSATEDGVIVKKEDVDDPDFVDRVTVIKNSTTVKMKNSVIGTGDTNHGAIVNMEPIFKDDNVQHGEIKEANTASARNTSDQ